MTDGWWICSVCGDIHEHKKAPMILKPYKGYHATAENEGPIGWHIHVEGTRDLITCHCNDGTTPEFIQETFEMLIEEYFKDCAAVGKEPDKPRGP